ncbi:histidinol-phosphate aminotransferase [Salirhabdus euzebyi]|uniref:Histidinol-phosphate aminotransferase n=1 Tax=Salirhabdus euzebyi TaxID=394506 RepID=A0A841PTT0_9BACI|nr:histidinol-phosphate transaminase [Salirhabdus euzebyi]MBB6452210.1 histidinol-phosphate aminotransferase [Salirhabdus euzebyi]
MKPKSSIPALKPYQPGKGMEEVKKEHNLSRIVKLASNENLYGCSPYVSDKLKEFGENAQFYPDGYALTLREKLSSFLSVEMDKIIFGSGSDEIVQMICRTYLEKGTNTVMATPTFPQYRHHATVEGAEVREIELENGFHNLTKMSEAIDENTRVVWLCTPNNPTGNYIKEEDLISFIQTCPKHVLLVIDEAYYEFVVAKDYPDSIALHKEHENIIVLRTFSKAYGLAGFRVGYGVGNEEVVRNLNTIRGPFNVTSIGQYAALHALDDQAFIEKVKQFNVQTRKKLEAFCAANNLTFYESETNFLLIHLPKSGLDVSNTLLTYGFIVRPGELLGIPNSIRVTIGKEEDMEEFQEALKKSLV